MQGEIKERESLHRHKCAQSYHGEEGGLVYKCTIAHMHVSYR